MYQSLTFFDVILAHDHPLLIGLLRITLNVTKMANDRLLTRIYFVTFLFLGTQLITFTMSMNCDVPHQGDAETHRFPNGKLVPLTAFGVCIVLVMVVVSAIVWFLWCKSLFATFERPSLRRSDIVSTFEIRPDVNRDTKSKSRRRTLR